MARSHGYGTLGRIVERGPVASVFTTPKHPYTQALLSAVPAIDPDQRRRRVDVDLSSFDVGAVLREVGREHFAAV